MLQAAAAAAAEKESAGTGTAAKAEVWRLARKDRRDVTCANQARQRAQDPRVLLRWSRKSPPPAPATGIRKAVFSNPTPLSFKY